MTFSRETFSWLDYLIFSVMMVAYCAIGIYYAIIDSKDQTQNEFFMGSRKLKWIPVAFSLCMSHNSAIAMLGKPAEVYLYGYQYVMSSFGSSLAILISAYTFVPMLYKLKLTSAYEVN